MTVPAQVADAFEAPVWFGASDAPLAGWVVRPASGIARGGVVLAGSIGREAHSGRRALRELARSLAARGFVTLRFDYLGTGDSSGPFDEPDRARTWVDSVVSAVSFLRSLGVESVTAVGMRLGATIVSVAGCRHELGLDAAVLWDPCESGRAYLRELGALEALRRDGVAVDSSGAVETAEYVFSAPVAAEMRTWKLSDHKPGSLGARVLVLTREDRTASERFREAVRDDTVEWATCDDQAALLDADPLSARLPARSLEAIAEWLDTSPGTPVPIAAHDEASSTAALTDEGHPTVTERFVRLGHNGLFAVVTEPVGAASGPWIVFLNVGNEEHSGPSRQWVELARTWAQHGLRCARFDVRGLGDSPGPVPARTVSLYDRAWVPDIVDVARAVSPDAPTVFVGLCSGGYLAMEAALTIGAAGVCAINPPVAMDWLHVATRLDRTQHATAITVATWMKVFAVHVRWVAMALWQCVRAVFPSRIATDLTAKVAATGTDVFVLTSAEDIAAEPNSAWLGWIRSRPRTAPSGASVQVVDGLDHSMHAAAGRRRAIDLLDLHVRERFASRTSPDFAPEDA